MEGQFFFLWNFMEIVNDKKKIVRIWKDDHDMVKYKLITAQYIFC